MLIDHDIPVCNSAISTQALLFARPLLPAYPAIIFAFNPLPARLMLLFTRRISKFEEAERNIRKRLLVQSKQMKENPRNNAGIMRR